MWDKFYIGLDLTVFENNGIQRPISRVTLQLDGENVLTAGDDSGLELTADCPHATQAMVNSLLAQLKGSTYKMYSAADANLDPSAELGDGITASGVYSVISRLADDGMGYPSPSAPGKEELEDEYPAGGPMTQAFDRKISETRSIITKTAEQIKLEVQKIENDIVTLDTTFTVELGKITSSIRDIDGKYSKLEQSINGFSLSVSNGETSSTIELKAGETVISSQNITMSGLVTFKGLESGETTIDGGCLKTGTIESMKINSSEITGTAIHGGEITGASITGNTITGGTITGSTINGALINGAIIEGGRFISSETHYWENDAYPPYEKSVLITDGMIEFLTNGQLDAHISADVNPTSGKSYGLHVLVSKSISIAIYGHANQILFGVSSYGISLGETSNHIVNCVNNIDMNNYSILNTSDARLKKNIAKSDIDALSVIRSMKTYSFDWKEDDRHENLGFIAQQLEKVNPDFVNIHPTDGHYSTKEMKIIPYLVKAVQELSAKLDGQKGARP